jgi:2Fe-2S ferredoxin
MAEIYITDRSGLETTIEIRPGTSLMQAATDVGVEDLLALCGGMCSCATCHVYIDSDHLDQLSPMSQDEHDLLEVSMHRQTNSRLACQVRMVETLDGLKATVAPGE